jgi:hypothetical protein
MRNFGNPKCGVMFLLSAVFLARETQLDTLT